jgi:hypothetical protein
LRTTAPSFAQFAVGESDNTVDAVDVPQRRRLLVAAACCDTLGFIVSSSDYLELLLLSGSASAQQHANLESAAAVVEGYHGKVAACQVVVDGATTAIQAQLARASEQHERRDRLQKFEDASHGFSRSEGVKIVKRLTDSLSEATDVDRYESLEATCTLIESCLATSSTDAAPNCSVHLAPATADAVKQLFADVRVTEVVETTEATHAPPATRKLTGRPLAANDARRALLIAVYDLLRATCSELFTAAERDRKAFTARVRDAAKRATSDGAVEMDERQVRRRREEELTASRVIGEIAAFIEDDWVLEGSVGYRAPHRLEARRLLEAFAKGEVDMRQLYAQRDEWNAKVTAKKRQAQQQLSSTVTGDRS